jgi:hypothetical protein
MSYRAPWIRPLIAFGIPLLAVVIGLPYLTGRGYGWPSLSDIGRRFNDVRSSVGHAVAGDRASGANVRLYECSGPTGRTLSSTPCGPNARAHDIDPRSVSTFHAEPVPVRTAHPSTPPGAAHDGSPAGILSGVREDLAAAQSVDAGRRAAAELDAQ